MIAKNFLASTSCVPVMKCLIDNAIKHTVGPINAYCAGPDQFNKFLGRGTKKTPPSKQDIQLALGSKKLILHDPLCLALGLAMDSAMGGNQNEEKKLMEKATKALMKKAIVSAAGAGSKTASSKGFNSICKSTKKFAKVACKKIHLK